MRNYKNTGKLLQSFFKGSLFLSVVVMAANTYGQIYTPTGSITGTSPVPFSGIGTSNPKAVLELQAQCAMPSTGHLGTLVITDNQSNGNCGFATFPNPSPTKGDLMYLRVLKGSFHTTAITEESIFKVKSDGLIGVGLGAPTAHFHLKSLFAARPSVQIESRTGNIDLLIDKDSKVGVGNNATLQAKFNVFNTLATQTALRIDNNGSDNTYGLLYKYTGSSLSHKAYAINNAQGKDVFTIFSNGYTIIGDLGNCSTIPGMNQANPAYRLIVENGILTEMVKVAVKCSSDWSDYVFADDYVLKPIDEVADYIKANKHLPNMPSTAEMMQNGNNLGQTDALLLKQIEELWLHTINQQQKLEEAEKMNARLEKMETMLTSLVKENQELKTKLATSLSTK